MELFNLIQQVDSREKFVNFLINLKADFIQRKDEWGNTSIDQYLDAISAWVEVMDTQYDTSDQIEKENKWQTIAKIFYIGKIYE